MNKKGLLIFLSLSTFLHSQTYSTEAGSNIGDTGSVSFKYRNETATYQTVRAADGNEWLQQNLGSTTVGTSIDDENAQGDYFQWGRWDDGHQTKNSETSNIMPVPNNPLGFGTGNAIFYIGGGTPWSGNYTGWFANPNQNDTWTAKNIDEVSEHNGMDPCKAIGENWEIPTENDWYKVLESEKIFPKPADAINNGITRGFNSNLKIVGAGSRKDDKFHFVGQRAYIWTKTASKNPNFYRYVYLGTYAGSTTGFGGDAKSHGYSVRCVNKTNNSLNTNTPKISNNKIVLNSTQNELIIISSDKIENIQIINTLGQKLLDIKAPQEQIVNISKLKSGIYFITVSLKNGEMLSQKFIKK